MRLRLVQVIGVIALGFTGMCAANAQSYHRLNAGDFMGVPQPNANLVAYTNTMVDYSYQPIYVNGYYKLKFNINVQVNKSRSWIDRSKVTSAEMLTEILKHEQGHYIFAYLMQQEMIKVANNMRFGNNYDQQVSAVFTAIKNKYRQLNDDYDTDTSHMLNRKQQNSWDMFFRQQLGQYQYNNMATLSQAR